MGSSSVSSTALEKGPADTEKCPILSTFCLSIAQNLGPELCWCRAPKVSLFPHLFVPRPLLSRETADKERDTGCSQTLKIRAVPPAPLLAPGQTPRAHEWCSFTRSHCFPRDPISWTSPDLIPYIEMYWSWVLFFWSPSLANWCDKLYLRHYIKSFQKADLGFIHFYAFVPSFWVTFEGLRWNTFKVKGGKVAGFLNVLPVQ